MDKTQSYRDSVCKPAVSVLRQKDFLPDSIRIINVSRDISADCSAVFMCLYINTDRACLLHFDKSLELTLLLQLMSQDLFTDGKWSLLALRVSVSVDTHTKM